MATHANSGFSHFVIRHRLRLTALLFGALLLEDILTGVRPRAFTDWLDPVGVAGAGLVIVGMLLRAWAAGILHKQNLLATAGPYAIVRHPLYLGSLFMALGFCLLLAEVENFVALLLVAAILYIPKIRGEERTLAQKFGSQWQAYKAKTYMLLPTLGAAVFKAHWSFAQWRRNKEYNALIFGGLGLAVFAWWARLH